MGYDDQWDIGGERQVFQEVVIEACLETALEYTVKATQADKLLSNTHSRIANSLRTKSQILRSIRMVNSNGS
jgi:hypothetical protein